MYMFHVIAVFALVCGTSYSVRVLPEPTLDIGEVTETSIELMWTMPPNEHYDEFVVEMTPDEGDVFEFNSADSTRRFINLRPGFLYTFTVRTVLDKAFGDPVVIQQDTKPAVPRNIFLQSFDTLVLTMEGPYFDGVQFTVETHGIEAVWDPPSQGQSECYHTEINDADGLTAIPSENVEITRGEELRQFINLIPGKLYTVTVYSATCGEGHLGELRSDGISSDIWLPPDSPPVLKLEETSTTLELTWSKPKGDYDNFVISENTDFGFAIEESSDTTNLGRNISRLSPCTLYEFEIHSSFRGIKSETPTVVSVTTRPQDPISIEVADFTDTSITLEVGSLPDALNGYEFTIFPGGRIIRTNSSTVTFSGLSSGEVHSVAVRSICLEYPEKTSLHNITLKQSTRPESPILSVHCEYIGFNDSELTLHKQVPWNAPEYSRVTVNVPKDENGVWDHFVVDYSPQNFEEGPSYPSGPLILPSNTRTTTVDVPVTGRQITVTVRTLRNNVFSEPTVIPASCVDPQGEAILRCRGFVWFWRLIVTPMDDGLLRIEIPDYPIHNATVHFGREILIFYNHTFIFRHLCETFPMSKIIVYPRCPESLPYCPVIVRPICQNRGRSRPWTFDACCNNRLYNTDHEICCHNKLLKKSERTTEECCLKKWYDRRTHKCCLSGQTDHDKTC